MIRALKYVQVPRVSGREWNLELKREEGRKLPHRALSRDGPCTVQQQHHHPSTQVPKTRKGSMTLPPCGPLGALSQNVLTRLCAGPKEPRALNAAGVMYLRLGPPETGTSKAVWVVHRERGWGARTSGRHFA